ncbi:MAG: hypothetical protein M1830_003028 [Pleopsidium flavum]|nr:MAG: hypothetical protein M1830_003028 [Pleopsidium flavum]
MSQIQHPTSAPMSRGKRIIVACDGTWLNSDNGFQKSALPTGGPNRRLQVPSNVTRICRAVRTDTNDQVPQIVYYQAGVGTGIGLYDRLVGGGAGVGLSEHIREGYDFIVNNYVVGDEIFLLGFSRGAFTARSISGLIGSIGILTKAGLPDFYEIFKDFENSRNPNYRPAYPNVPFPNKPNIKDPNYRRELRRRGLTTLNISIKAVAVWDTVGSLGIPRIPWLGNIGFPKDMKEYAFDNVYVGDHVENAFQALALDEHRDPFSPSVWEKPRGSRTVFLPTALLLSSTLVFSSSDGFFVQSQNLKQVWFPGVHSNIGGGYDDADISDITLAWMMSQLDPFIEFNGNYILRQHELTRRYYVNSRQPIRPWSFGKILNSSTAIYALAGSKTRTPGAYHKTDPATGRPTSKPLRNTNEYIHASVRTRVRLSGPGINDRGVYEPAALKGWRVIGTGREDGRVRWELGGSSHKGFAERVLWEDELGDVERKLLGLDPKVYDFVLKGSPRPRR